MNPQFSQPQRTVAVEVNKQSIARDFGVKHNQVAYLKVDVAVDSYKLLFDKTTETVWANTATGTIVSWAISGTILTLVTSAGTTQLYLANNDNIILASSYGAQVGQDNSTIFAMLASKFPGAQIDLENLTYRCDTLPAGAAFINGGITTNSLATGNAVTFRAARSAMVIGETGALGDTGAYEAVYTNPLTGDTQPSGRSTLDLYAVMASQNSRASGPSRAVVIGSIYCYSSGNVSGNYSARQCRSTVPQSVNIGSEDCRVDGGFRGSNISSITSHSTGETGVNLASRRGWATGTHCINIASVDAYAGGGRGAVLKATVNGGAISAITIVSAGLGYSGNGVITFYDRLGVPTTAAAATYTVNSSTGAIETVTLTNVGAGYSTTQDAANLFEAVQVTVLEAGKYAANIATANGCAVYGEISFNLGANNCSAKADRTGNIASSASSTSATYAVNIGSTSAVASGMYALNLGSVTANATAAQAANFVSTSSDASGAQSVNLGTNQSTNAGVRSLNLMGGGNIIAAGADGTVIYNGTNCGATLASVNIFGRRVTARAIRTTVWGDSGTGTYATANIKAEIVHGTGNINIAGVLTQSTTFTDLAKMFENIEYTPIPVGALVAWEGRKVRLAKAGDNAFSVHSRTYATLYGDSQFTWASRYLRDEFGEILTEEVMDEELGIMVTQQKINPDFDEAADQIPRSERRDEWTPVALVGEVHTRVDASVSVDSYVQPSATPGIGMSSTTATRLRCMEITSPYDETRGYAIALCLRD